MDCKFARIGKNWHGVQHSCTPFGGAPDIPLALRANPATVPGVRLVRLVRLARLVRLVRLG